MPRRAPDKTIRSVVYLCAPHNWGEPILPEILLTPVKRGKVISLLTGARQATPTGALGERTRPYGVWSICAHPITGVNPYSRRYCLHQSRGEGYFPSCKAGCPPQVPQKTIRQRPPQVQSRGKGRRQRPPQVPSIRSVVYLCAPHNWGEPILPEILLTPVKRGKVISPLDWCKAGNAHRRCLGGERTRPYGVWSICAHPITGVNPYSRRYCLHQSRGKVISPLDWCKAGNAHRRCPRRERTRPYGVWSICAHPITGVNPYSRRYCLPVKRGKGYFPS